MKIIPIKAIEGTKARRRNITMAAMAPQPTMVVAIHSLPPQVFFSTPNCLATSFDGDWTNSVESGRVARGEEGGAVTAGQVLWVPERSFIFEIKQDAR